MDPSGGLCDRYALDPVHALFVFQVLIYILTFDGKYYYEYDNVGNVIVKRHYLFNSETRYSYNDKGLLKKVEFPSGLIEEYIYDAFGNRIKKIEEWGTTVYIYASNNNLVYQEFIAN